MASSAIAFEVAPGEHAAGRVGRRVDDEEPRPGRDQRGQLVDVEPEVVGHPDRDRDRRRADEAGQRLVDRVAGIRDEDLVAGVDQAEDRVQHHALATDRDEDLERLDREALARGGIGGDRLAQGRDPGERRVVRRAGVERRLRGLPDVGRRVEVGLAELEVDDRAALRLERAGAGGHLEGALGADGVHPGRDPHGLRPPTTAASGEARTTRWPAAPRGVACTTDTSAHRRR